jgi:aspartyl-tRNA(Asn)/glutamyl-tRNA(Gln) amidotransferase subunit A
MKKEKPENTIGKLHGVCKLPLKMFICYKDHPLTAASGILKNFTSLYSATSIEKLLTGRSHHYWC